MFRIGICDDEMEQRNIIHKLCQKCFQDVGQEFECFFFSSGEEVQQYTGEILHLLFLDIELGNVDGIQVLKHYEHTDLVWRIVFVSSHNESVFDTFGLRTLDFGEKPITIGKMKRWVTTMIKENKENIDISFPTYSGDRIIEIEKILYLKGAANYTYVHTIDDVFLVSGNLKMWESKLENSTIRRIHKSYLVNIQRIKKMEGNAVCLLNDEVISIGRLYKKNLQEAYRTYISGKINGRI